MPPVRVHSQPVADGIQIFTLNTPVTQKKGEGNTKGKTLAVFPCSVAKSSHQCKYRYSSTNEKAVPGRSTTTVIRATSVGFDWDPEVGSRARATLATFRPRQGSAPPTGPAATRAATKPPADKVNLNFNCPLSSYIRYSDPRKTVLRYG